MDFEELINTINETNDTLQKRAVSSINKYLTIRNWLIGFYIVEFEQYGADKAKYGNKILKELAKKLKNIKGMSESQLYLYKEFYLVYPQIFLTVSGKFFPEKQLENIKNSISLIIKDKEYSISPDELINKLSFSHFIELMNTDTDLHRLFYEIQTIKNHWSVRELKRAKETLLFERTGLSKDKEKVIAKAKEKMSILPADTIKGPYLLEFLGLEEKSEYSESDLEQAIINHLQLFLIEMGRGFCFESRQKRITIDNTHYYIDLLFYHRILKCHVIIDLKLGKFSHADAGQMNVYLNYYKKNEMTEGDNPPVGLILCADKSNSLVEYATSGMDNQLFVSKYMLALPSKEELQKFIDNEIAKRTD